MKKNWKKLVRELKNVQRFHGELKSGDRSAQKREKESEVCESEVSEWKGKTGSRETNINYRIRKMEKQKTYEVMRVCWMNSEYCVFFFFLHFLSLSTFSLLDVCQLHKSLSDCIFF